MPTDSKQQIQTALANFARGDLQTNALALFAALGYRSNKQLGLPEPTRQAFWDTWGDERFNQTNALWDDWRAVDLVLQLTETELNQSAQRALFDARAVDLDNYHSYLIFCVELAQPNYSRTELARITREINKLFKMPALILFKHGETLTLSVIDRRLHQRDADKDVLEKVTLIKDIRFRDPHRAHIEILNDLSLPKLSADFTLANFTAFHEAWREVLDTSELNKKFFRELANWFYWAQAHVTFPSGAGKNQEERNATSLIRLITRLIFTWFIQEKELVPPDLFDENKIQALLKEFDPQSSTYYKAILQNLFFGTLNTEMRTDKGAPNRKFIVRAPGYTNPQHMVHNVYRYENAFANPAAFLKLTENIPFLNGGLFECLDKEAEGSGKREIIRIDGFSERIGDQLAVPNYLFFAERNDPKFFSPKDNARLNEIFGTKNKPYEVRGLLRLLHRYKFTIDENTPIEQEVALDPELLGKVFENLLAAYNPETGVTARKQTGSFYTPREIVNYMVDEALIAYLEERMKDEGGRMKIKDEGGRMKAEEEDSSFILHPSSLNSRLRHLFSYTTEPPQFDERETAALVEAIDDLKLLDPACGSGAFPMGALHKLVFILHKLDPDNARWKEKQIRKMSEIPDPEQREKAIQDVEQAFSRNELDYGRKLYLIENCIYGVDIQPIAVQIAKLRAFISLIVDERVDDRRENRGVRPLPNLETKFVAANTLLGIEKPAQMMFRNPAIEQKEKELGEVRRNLFTARTRETKEKYRKRDAALRKEISELLKKDGWRPGTANQLAGWDPYDQNAHAEFFDAEWMFGMTDGFDITLGNPPYVRADSGEKYLKMRRAIEATGQYETLWEKWDLYIPFIELGYKLLKPNGVTTMIVSDAYCHSKYAEKSQKWFLQNSRILRLDFFSKIKIFDAAVRNITYLFQNTDGSTNEPQRRVHNPEFGSVNLLPTAPQSELTYRVFFPEDANAQTITVPTLKLDQICYISVGMVVHADEKVAQGEFELDDLVSDKRDKIHSKPFVEGKYLARWIPITRKWLEWGTKRAPALFRRPTFPELYDVPEKLISVDMSAGVEKLRVVYDDGQLYHNHSAWSFVLWNSLKNVRNQSIKKAARYRGETPQRSDLPLREELEGISKRFSLKFLLGIMNSTFAHDFLRANRRSNIHLYPDDWKKLPIADVSRNQQEPIIKLVDRILAAKRADPDADTTAWEREIDELVYALYGLTEEEIKIVEGKERLERE
jgi:adenine-specific DNA-methyltransferase